ncbi:hypothetical protein J6590_012065 [Homalodisca vitripennis]|nr:hypothetical protein J6590_012065 [Homalodisca vitripennis]
MQTLSERGVSVELGGGRLAVKNSVKTLGVVLDSNLTFSEHVTFSAQRAVGRLIGLHKGLHRTLLAECAKMQIMQSMDVCRMMTCCMVHKELTTGKPEYLSERLLRREDVSERWNWTHKKEFNAFSTGSLYVKMLIVLFLYRRQRFS